MDPKLLQKDLDEMLVLFKEMGLHPNASKTKFMIFRGAPAPRALNKVKYDKIRRSKRIQLGMPHRQEWRKRLTTCRICGKRLMNAALGRHMKDQHKITSEKYKEREDSVRGNYCLDFKKGMFNKCPVVNCSGGARDKFGMYCHFCLIHPRADIIIEQDGELPKCIKCGMRVADLNKHVDSYTCRKGSMRRINEVRQKEQAAAEKV